MNDRLRTIRAFLGLNVASSVLQCALVLSIYHFHIAGPFAYLLALIAISPLCIIVLRATQRRTVETDSYVRQLYVGAILYAGAMIGAAALLVTFSLSFVTSLRFAGLICVYPLVTGILPAIMLLIPRRMMNGGILGDSFPPVRLNLATPAFRRIFRMTALYIVYITLNFASRVYNYTFTGMLAYIVALLPVLPLFGLIPIYTKYMAEEQDEFQRHLFHQSILWAFFGTLVLASAIGRLQDHSLIFRHHPDFFRPYSVFPIFWWLHFEAVYVVNAIQAARIAAQEKKDR